MPDFTVRVELHGASAEDYSNLHDAMAKSGFFRAFVALDGHTYELPTAEYAHTSNSDQFAVRDLALNVARSIKIWAKDPWVLVTKAEGDRAVSTRRVR